jgi:starch phosphorylase
LKFKVEKSMSEETPVIHPLYNLLPTDVEGFESLVDLALDMRWSWNHATDEIWRQLDATLWDMTRHPCDVLQTVSREKLRSLLGDPIFRKKIDALTLSKKQSEDAPAWFQQTHPNSSLNCVAYFCMEFMLSEALPIYSGGLGNVAGDQLKAASDLGVPVVGVGLLYQQGYFRQVISKDGSQQALYPYNDPGQLPITPLRKPNGEWLRLEITLPGYSLWLRAWQVQVGSVKLYLLDSNDVANNPATRGITSELYGGGAELRLKQEMVLGIGGWRLLRELGLQPEVCHLNEGHAAFAVLERARDYMQATGQPFEAALSVTRAGNLFTTHTAVDAGFDRFAPALIEQYFARYTKKLGITLNDLLALGRRNPNDASEAFNMAYLAIRGSGAANAVSRLHGGVSRHLFEPLFPNWPHEEIPVGYVTNGVHMPTWDSAEADELWTEVCGKDRWLGTEEVMGQNLRQVSDAKLWQFRFAASRSFVDYVHKRVSLQLAETGASPQAVTDAGHFFDPNVLTLGFARRFASYKRPNLLLHDPERLLRILTNPQRPVQLIIAGKAHPSDLPGQELIRQWTQFIQRPEVRRHVIFLSDYNMLLSESLVQGVDVWINTPRRPWEACGTSGMKVLVNGGINLSELDGWWAEAYNPQVGWALGDGLEHGDDPAWDAHEAEALYDLLEREVIPEYYNRNEHGIPTAWVNRIRESMAQLTPHFSSSRAVREYTEQYYLPATLAYLKRSANNGAIGVEIVNWRHKLEQQWGTLRIGEMRIGNAEDPHEIEVQLYLGGLDPDAVLLELYANGINGNAPERVEMKRVRHLVGTENGYAYRVHLSNARPIGDYTARILPRCDGVSTPLEETHILWQR